LAWLLRWSGARVGVALVYHRVEPRPRAWADSLVPVVSTTNFEGQARHLAARYQVVPAGTLHDAAMRRRRGRRFPVAITFDDDLASHRSTALPVLRKYRLPATMFLCGASLDGPHPFWWEHLERGANDGLDLAAVATDVLERNLVELHEVAAAIEDLPGPARRRVGQELRRRVGPGPEDGGLRADDVAALAAAGMEIGFHTREHHRLTDLDDADLDAALTGGRSDLAQACGAPLDTVAYPHGRADARVAAAARRAGYRVGFTTEGAGVGPSSDPLLLGRVDPSWVRPGDFAFWLTRRIWHARRTA
jgi:peptidoglycan/xylan/chitin deacetylase (PgdA/CDA1 family)